MGKICNRDGCERGCYGEFCLMHKPRKPIAIKKRIKQMGRRGLEYKQWRDDIAIPYLDATYGHKCAQTGCTRTTGLDVDHIQNRGSHPDLIMNLDNVQYLCRPHHMEKSL